MMEETIIKPTQVKMLARLNLIHKWKKVENLFD